MSKEVAKKLRLLHQELAQYKDVESKIRNLQSEIKAVVHSCQHEDAYVDRIQSDEDYHNSKNYAVMVCPDCGNRWETYDRHYFQSRPQKKDMHTFSEWGKVLGYEIVSPDGFDSTDPCLRTRLFTEKSFQDGLILSVVRKIVVPENEPSPCEHENAFVDFIEKGASVSKEATKPTYLAHMICPDCKQSWKSDDENYFRSRPLRQATDAISKTTG